MNLYETVEHLLRSNPNFVGENDEILKTKVSEAVTNLDPYLVKIFKNNDLTRQVFFQQLEDVWVLNQEKLKWVINSKEFLEDSYTSYTNEIGLTTGGKFLKANSDVVLDFPYKDAVLAGGQDKDDQKRQEIMYHEVLGYDQITNLKAPKVLANAKRYTVHGIEEGIAFNDEDNLIIKGNNYAALNSMLVRYRGKVKLIYIDPPYNTENDSFQYNDKFNHSSWLTFMKSRLEISKELLTDDGVIFVQCDDKEQAYLKVLMDEIFNVDSFINNISIKMSEPSGNKMAHVSKRLTKIKESILLYKKSPNSQVDFNPIKVPKQEWDTEYNKIFTNLSKKDKNKINEYNDLINEGYDLTTDDIKMIDNILSEVIVSSTEKEYSKTDKTLDYVSWCKENSYRIFRTAASSSVKKLADTKKLETKQDYFAVKSARDGLLYIALGTYSDDSASPRVQVLFAEDYLTTYLGDFWSDISTTGLEVEGQVNLKNGKKPEKLIQRIIEFGSSKNDLVLDFFMGSATTQAVAMKLQRKFIGIEQMDYINTISIKRLQNVIEGEKNGISKAVDWQGGGTFVYCELLEDGQRLIDKIQSANQETIQSVKEKIYHSEQIVPYILTADLEKADQDFNILSLDEQKQVLIGLINKNKLYVNYSSIDDEDYQIKESDRKFSRSFYEGGDISE